MKPNPGKPELMDAFARWLERHGRTGVFVKTKAYDLDGDLALYGGGGRVFIAAGEIAPYMTTTVNQFVETGRAVRVGNRVTMV